MTTPEELRARVDERYAALGLPSWPDPHAGLDEVDPAAYSRCTEPERYRVVLARARVWAGVLRDVLGARLEDVAGQPARGRHAFLGGVRVVPRRDGAAAMLLLEHEVPGAGGGAALARLTVALDHPDRVVELLPDCGCDACDSGSAPLLESLDDTVLAVVRGPYVQLYGDGWSGDWHPDGGSASSDGRGPDLDAVVAWCRRLADGAPVALPPRTTAWVSRGWLD